MSKKYLLAFLAFFSLSLSLKASHIVGNEISYRYIGDSTNISKHYLIRYTAYSFSTVINLSNTINLGFTSGCNAGGTLTATLLPNFSPNGLPINQPFNCDNGQINVSHGKKYVYEVDVALPVNCSNWVFYHEASIRHTSPSNLLNTAGSTYFVKAELNSFYKNTSPIILNSGGRNFCSNGNGVTIYSQQATEPDGDSLVYYFGHAETSPYPGTPMTYAPGYSVNSQITTANGMNLDPQTGIMLFQPTNAELVNLKISIDEFRFDSIQNSWIKISTVSKDLDLQVSNNCTSSSVNWKFSSTNSDSIVRANCGDSIISFSTTVPFSCSTLANDGSDFFIYRSDGSPMPVKSAKMNCSAGHGSIIHLQTYFPISKNDSLYIVSNRGSDFNSLINYCGFELPEDDSIPLVVNNCSTIGLDEKPVEISLFPNPAKNKLSILFADGGPMGNVKIRILDSMGRNLYLGQNTFSGREKVDVPIDKLAPGLYIIVLELDTGELISKIFEKSKF